MAEEFSEEQKFALDRNLELLTSKAFLIEILAQSMYLDSAPSTYKELCCEVGFYFHPETGEIIDVTNNRIPKQYRIWQNVQYARMLNPKTKDYAYIVNANTNEKIPTNFKKARFEVRQLTKTNNYEIRKMEYIGARAPTAQKIIEESMLQFNQYQEKRSNRLCNRLKRFMRRLELAIDPDKKTIFE